MALGQMKDANFPMDQEGRTYHVGLKRGEASNLVLMVGDPKRAELLKDFLDRTDQHEIFSYASSRGFLTYTGLYGGKRVSIMSIGMGIAMADFAVRELRAVIDGPMFILRLGSCGALNPSIKIGSIVVAKRSLAVTTNYDGYRQGTSDKKFSFSLPIDADNDLHELLLRQLKESGAEGYGVVEGTDVTTDSFYATQGRKDSSFADDNENLISDVINLYPDIASLQMETFHLYHLARISKEIKTAAAAIVFAERHSNNFIDKATKENLEKAAGRACLETLLACAKEAH